MGFHIPVLADVVPRPRLYQLMDSHSLCRIVLVTGQAAQGKSTMVAGYLREREEPSLWLHLTPSLSKHGKLFDLLSRGLGQVLGSRGQTLLPPHITLGSRQDLLRQAEILVMLMNELSAPLNIVLDDLESLSDGDSSLELIQALLGDAPEGICFFLLSRKIPPLNLSRFKMSKQMLALTNEDLAFTLEETEVFFRETGEDKGSESPLAPNSLEKILEITNGWAGGLVLVSEAVRRSQGLEQLPDQLSSEAFSYFSQEIYQGLPKDIRSFLMKTALFEELDTRILSLLFIDIDPGDFLSRLERRNLFIQKLTPGKWPVFKYNNLFRDFLRADLAKGMDRDQIQALNFEIGRVFWQEKDHEKAIHYFMAADAHERIARILRIKGADYVITGRADRLADWIKALPGDVTRDDPWLIFFKTMAGRIKGGKKNIRAFDHALELFEAQEETRGILLSQAYLIEASVFIRQPSQAILKRIRAGEKTLARLGGKYRFTWARTLLWQQIGLGYIVGTGDIPKGISACRNAIVLAQGIENKDLVLNASVILTLGFVQSGDFKGAREMLGRIKSFAQEERHPEYRALENIVNIDLALKRGDTGKAGELLNRSEADIEKFGLIFLYPGFVEARAVYHIYTGQYDQAFQGADHLSDFSILEGNDFYQGISHRIKAMASYRKGDFTAAKEHGQVAVLELDKSKRGDIHLFLAREILGFALYRLGDEAGAKKELEAVLDYFSRMGLDLNICETAFSLGMLSRGEISAAFFETGFEKAAENQYHHFPLMDDPDLGRAIARAWEVVKGPETLIIPYLNQLESPLVTAAVQKEISIMADGWSKKVRGEQTDRFRPLFKAASPKLWISTFGSFTVTLGTRDIPVSAFGGTKPLLLLKTLLLKTLEMNRGREVPKEMLMDALWPEAGEQAGNKNLKINLHRLRKALDVSSHKEFGHSYLNQKAGRLFLDPDLVTIDIDLFEMACTRGKIHESRGEIQEALACYAEAGSLYHGDFFEDDPYLELAGQYREVFRRNSIEILKRKAGLHGKLNQAEAAIKTWNRVLEIDSCHEEAFQNLILLYARAGMRTEAEQAFARCRTVLEEELDSPVDPRTLEIYEQMVKQAYRI